MRFKRLFSLFSVITLISTFITSCNNEETPKSLTGNLTTVVLEPGDVYAVFDFNGFGEVTFKLFPDIAPVAVDRFTVLAERGYYDGKNIHRVIGDFIMQGGSLYGDGTDGEIQAGESFDVEASEFARNFYGALCMAADENKKNCYQFYIVNNKNSVDIYEDIKILEEQLNDTTRELKPEAKSRYDKFLADMQALPENVKEMYKTKGGVFRLDGNNTVFGQMIDGGDVIDAIAAVEVVAGNRTDDYNNIMSKPLDEILISSVKIVRIPLPEPTTAETEESTSKGKKKKATTTTTTSADDPGDLTDVVVFGGTTAPETSDDLSGDLAENMPEDTDAIITTGEDIVDADVSSDDIEISDTVSETDVTDEIVNVIEEDETSADGS